MFPILPSTGMQVETHSKQTASDNEIKYAQKHGRVLKLSPLGERAPSRSRLVLLAAAVIITLALLAAFG